MRKGCRSCSVVRTGCNEVETVEVGAKRAVENCHAAELHGCLSYDGCGNGTPNCTPGLRLSKRREPHVM